MSGHPSGGEKSCQAEVLNSQSELRTPNTGPSRLGSHRKGSLSVFPWDARLKKDRYRAINTGICSSAGRQPASGLIYNRAVRTEVLQL